RRSRSRGMLFYRVLELAVAHGPVRYQDLVMSQSPKAVRQSRRDNADIRPAWSDLRRAARGGKSLTPVKWIPQTCLMGKIRNGESMGVDIGFGGFRGLCGPHYERPRSMAMSLSGGRKEPS